MSRIAVVHPMSLLGKEVVTRLHERPDLCSDLRLLAVDEAMVGTVTEGLDGASFVGRVDEDALEGVDLTLFCGEIALDRQAIALLPSGGRALVASRGATVDDGLPAIAGVEEFAWLGQERLLCPAAATVGLVRLLEPLRPLGLRRAVATAVLPASEIGSEAIDTLFEESRALLSMTRPPKSPHFAAQLAFNLLPGLQPGEEIVRQVSAVFGAAALPPGALAVQTVQAGIFHAVALSLYVELERPTDAPSLRKLLGRSGAGTLAKKPGAVGPVMAAGEEDLLVGEVRGAGGSGYWIWAAIDNLTVGGATHLLRLVETALRPGAAS